MNQYYLIAQLPSLDGIGDGMPLPITEEAFLELCRRFLPKRSVRALDEMTLAPKRERKKTGSPLLDAWCDGERSLRLALAEARGARRGKGNAPDKNAMPQALAAVVLDAVGREDPLEAELLLNRYRLSFLETLRPSDAFAEDTVFYYGLKLKLLLHIRKFDVTAGEAAYRTIYHSILDGEKPEVIQ